MNELSTQCVWNAGATLGEGPLWDAARGRLLFVDVRAPHLHEFDPSSGRGQIHVLPEAPCWVVPRTDGDGYMLGQHRGVARLHISPLKIEQLGLPLGLTDGMRLNDAKADAYGALWFGSMNDADPARPDGRLFRLAADGELAVADSGIHICNGPAFSLDGRSMYHNDSYRGRTFAYPIDAKGVSGERQVYKRFDYASEGAPDGMTVDADGGLWIAQWGGSRVCRYLADGSLDMVVHVPVSQPSSCAFGGEDMRTLYITSAADGLSAEERARQPLAGGLFAVRPGMAGLRAAAYGA